jgi:hypothetical protein
MDDWEDWADETKEIEDNTVNKKFADEEVVDKDKEERERKERQEAKKELQEQIKKTQEEKKKDEKDYEKIYNDRIKKAGALKTLSREEIKRQNPTLTEAQIDELMSRQAEEGMGENLFSEDTEATPKNSLGSSIKELKGEKAYKAFGREVAEYMIANGQSHNHIPKFFGELFNALSDKITITKMKTIVNDFNDKLQKQKDEEDRKKAEEKKLEKKEKGGKNKKKATVGGVTKALDTNKMLMADVFNADEAEGEGDYDYGDEGDQYVDYGRDNIDFM